jgi:hypothetical protein
LIEQAKLTPRKMKNLKKKLTRRAKRELASLREAEVAAAKKLAADNAFLPVVQVDEVIIPEEKDVLPKYIPQFRALWGQIPMTRSCTRLPSPTVKLIQGVWVYCNTNDGSDIMADVNHLISLLADTYRSRAIPADLDPYLCTCVNCRDSKPTWKSGKDLFYSAPPQPNTTAVALAEKNRCTCTEGYDQFDGSMWSHTCGHCLARIAKQPECAEEEEYYYDDY